MRMKEATTALMSSRRRVVAAGAGVLVLALLAAWLVARPPGGANRNAAPAVYVTAVKIGRQDVPIYRQGLGTVQALNTVIVRARVDGVLDQMLFTEGQHVKAGEVLARIDPALYQAAYDQALAKKQQDVAMLPSARRDLQRFEALGQKQFATDQNIEKQRSALAQLEATIKADDAMLERARIELSYTRITAPIEGRIGLRRLDVGNAIRAADPEGLAVISQVNPVAVVFTLPGEDLAGITGALKGGNPQALVYRYDNSEKLAEGTLMAIDSAVDQTTGTVKLKAEVPNESDILWPGMSVRVRLLMKTEPAALVISDAALQRGPNGVFVYVVQPDSTVAVKPVEFVAVGDGKAIITQGVAENDSVVTNGQSRLRAGARVIVGDAASVPAAAGAH